MFSHYFQQIENIAIYPSISLFIFIIFFILVLFVVVRLKKEYIEYMSHIPLDDSGTSERIEYEN